MNCKVRLFTDGNMVQLQNHVNEYLGTINNPNPNSNVRVEFSTHPNPDWGHGPQGAMTIFSAMVTHYW